MKKILAILVTFSFFINNAFAYGPSAEDIKNMMNGGQGGPSAEDMQRQGEAKGLVQMKSGIATFKNGAEKWKVHMEKCKNNGGDTYGKLLEVQKQVDEVVSIVNNASSIAEAQKGFDMIDSITSTINDVLPKCAMMKELPNLVERAENEYKKLEKGLAEVK
ncbi:MAG: hypothetical protein PHF46_04850, partial [Candidatus Gracilibacteria bacterium]|nr:hypothetical protein [Candidatus Gracilibacteria bacterium]